MVNLKVAYISTFPPKICGIGSYTRDLIAAMKNISSKDIHQVIALNSSKELYKYETEVVHQFHSDDISDFVKEADYLNSLKFDVISLQHEYGLYGGEMGDYILCLMEKLDRPIITTIHMVSPVPSPHQYEVTRQIIRFSKYVAVMTNLGKKDLIKIYKTDKGKIKVIPHGAPDVPFGTTELMKGKLGLEGKKVLTSVNILRSSRGVDLVIEALKEIVIKYPEVIYIIIGPDPGDQIGNNPYRRDLIMMVKKMGLEQNVIFKEKYLPILEITKYIQASDIFLTPYRPPEESSSGSLAYAVAAGKVCVSTPFGYAREVLGSNRGKLIEWENPEDIAKTIGDLFSDPSAMTKMAEKTYAYGRKMIWSEVAKKYRSAFLEAV